jgi:uncharacterized protein involved in exopolysaccharide biosynthesis
MSLTQFLRILWARRMLVLVTTISTFAAAFLVAQLLPERYEAKSRVLLDVVKPDPVTGQVLAANSAKGFTRTQVELVRDQRVASDVVEKLRLDQNPELQRRYEESGQNSGAGFRAWLTQSIVEGTQARMVEGSNVLEISFTAPSAEMARSVADALRQSYVDSSLSSRREGARQSADWYLQQTEKARLSLQQAEQAKTEFEKRTGLILEGTSDIDSARLQALATQGTPIAASGGGGGQVVSTPSSAQLAQVDASIAQASQSLGPNHPEMQELQRRRAALAGLAAQERAAAGAAANAAAGSAARSATAGASAINQAYQAQRSKVVGQRANLEQLRRLQTEVDVRREQYAKTATRAAELRQQADVSDSGLAVLGGAIASDRPVFPNRPLILGGALGFGFAFGILLALLLELMNRRVRGVEDMVSIREVPLLAVISVPSGSRGETPLLGWSGRQ